jgi:hypothetical protein
VAPTSVSVSELLPAPVETLAATHGPELALDLLLGVMGVAKPGMLPRDLLDAAQRLVAGSDSLTARRRFYQFVVHHFPDDCLGCPAGPIAASVVARSLQEWSASHIPRPSPRHLAATLAHAALHAEPPDAAIELLRTASKLSPDFAREQAAPLSYLAVRRLLGHGQELYRSGDLEAAAATYAQAAGWAESLPWPDLQIHLLELSLRCLFGPEGHRGSGGAGQSRH